MSETPYIGYSNETLRHLPEVDEGETVRCPNCGEQHPLKAGTPLGVGEIPVPPKDGARRVEEVDDSKPLLFFNCRGATYLAAVSGRLVLGTKPDVSSGS